MSKFPPEGFASYYPEHDRTSCSDHDPSNATPDGSTGCARCTALIMDRATAKPPQFPTMLRKMWSGGEVQSWIDENWNKAPASPRAPDVGRCNEVPREQGKAYPRTCAVCGLGPCRRGLEHPR